MFKMKIPSICLIVLLMIFNILVLGVNSTNSDEDDENGFCRSVNDACSIDNDCCTQNCRITFYFLQRYCKEPINMISSYKFFISPSVQTWTCVYTESGNKNISARLNRTFGYNAAHNNLPPGTVVEVTYGGVKETITINNHRSNLLGETLELSEYTAKKLGFKDYGLGPCQVIFPGLTSYKVFVKRVLFILVPFQNVFHILTWIISKLG